MLRPAHRARFSRRELSRQLGRHPRESPLSQVEQGLLGFVVGREGRVLGRAGVLQLAFEFRQRLRVDEQCRQYQ